MVLRAGRKQRTLLEVVGLPHVDADERHQLQLRQALAGGGREGEELAQVRDLRVDEVAAELAGAFRGFALVEPGRGMLGQVSC